jgi:hypothetical protein
MSTRIPYEDAQTAANQLVQCATNLLSVRNFRQSLKTFTVSLQRTDDVNRDLKAFIFNNISTRDGQLQLRSWS